MTIFEAIGIAYTIFATVAFTVGLGWLAWRGVQTIEAGRIERIERGPAEISVVDRQRIIDEWLADGRDRKDRQR